VTSVTLADVLLTDELSRRPRRPSDDVDSTARLTAVVGEVGNSAPAVLQRTAAEALLLCHAHSAGVTLLEGGRQAEHQTLRRQAVVGPWANYTGSTVPRSFSPEGVALDQGATQLFHAPERYYLQLREARPSAREILLVPFDRSSCRQPGVVWVVLHDTSRQFDLDDARRLHALTRCASVAFSVAMSVNATARATTARQIDTGGHRLSAREEQVCILIAQGHTNKEIGALLGISAKSVETYRARVADKLNFRTRADYVRFALARGWLDTPSARGGP